MQFEWKDYNKNEIDENILLDEAARKNTGLSDGIKEFYEYWLKQNKIGENLWCKFIYESNKLIGFISIGEYESEFTIMEFVIQKDYRCKGYGTKILKELLENSKNIINKDIEKAKAVIYTDNLGSKKCFEKAGFIYQNTHPDGDCAYYKYKKWSENI